MANASDNPVGSFSRLQLTSTAMVYVVTHNLDLNLMALNRLLMESDSNNHRKQAVCLIVIYTSLV